MRITHQIHLLVYKIKQRVLGTQIDKIRRGGRDDWYKRTHSWQ